MAQEFSLDDLYQPLLFAAKQEDENDDKGGRDTDGGRKPRPGDESSQGKPKR